MSDFESEITPGVARLVAFLNENGHKTHDSGDGVTNQELNMGCAMDGANVFLDLTGRSGVDGVLRIEDVYQLLKKLGVDFEGSGPEAPVVGLSYDPSQKAAGKGCMGYVMNVTDEMIWGTDPELPRKRLEYQIRYCDNWIANPPIEKMVAAGESASDVVVGIEHYESLRETFTARLAALSEEAQ